MKSPENKSKTPIYQVIATALLLIAGLFGQAVYPENTILKAVFVVLLVIDVGWIIREHRASLKGRSAAYGLNSFITVLLVLSILGVLNFLGAKYPKTLDLTANKIHTLSDQTEKVVRGLTTPVKATLYDKAGAREKYRPLLDQLKGFSTQFEVEYIDPDKEPIRARQAGIKKYGTLHLAISQPAVRESRIEEPTEEKVTNALIKLLKEKANRLCFVTGHGESSIASTEADGYSAVKKGLEDQSTETREVNLLQDEKTLAECSALAINGAKSAFFPREIEILKTYLADGGRAIIALDFNLKTGESAPELKAVLKDWHVSSPAQLVVDPVSRIAGVDASVPIIASFSRDHVITREFSSVNCYFPFMRPLEILENTPVGLNIQWVGQTTKESWAVGDLASLSKGAVAYQPGRDKKGPLNAALAIEGKLKDSKASRNTRLAVFGTALFATNNYSRFGGNLDFYLNAAAWVLEDESLISIRSKEDVGGKIELSEKTGNFIWVLTVFVIPFLIAVSGVVIWIVRKRL